MTEVIELVNRMPEGDFCETPTARKIFNLLDYCRAKRWIGLVAGAPGVGKTTAIRRYAATHKGIFVCPLSRSDGASMSATLQRVCEAMGAGSGPRRVSDLHEVICNQVQWVAEDAVLVLDEAQFLNDASIDELRCIHDLAGLAIVFCGNPTFRSRFNNSRDANFAQFTSRVGMRLDCPAPTDADLAAICRHHDIAGKREMDFLAGHAKTSGGLRTVVWLASMARDIADDGRPLRLEDLKAAAKMQGVSE